METGSSLYGVLKNMDGAMMSQQFALALFSLTCRFEVWSAS